MTISKSKLKARMLELFRQLEEEGGELIVTDHGRQTLSIRPLKRSMHEVFEKPKGEPAGLEALNEPTDAEWDES